MKVVIVGAGEVGVHIATRLVDENKDVVLIDSDPQRVAFVKETLDVQAIQGEGSSPRALAKAGIDTADVLIAVTTSDEVNMIACLIAKAQAQTPVKIARIRNQDYTDHTDILKREYLGVDLHINPEKEAALTIFKLLQIPCATEAIDLADGLVKLVGVRIGDNSPVVGQQLQYLSEFHPSKKVLIAAIEREGKILIPGGRDTMEIGDTVWVLSMPENVDHVLAGLGMSCPPMRRVMLLGGTNIARFLAEKLLDVGVNLRIVDKDYDRCVALAEQFPKAVVLHSPLVDPELFEEENIQGIDAFVSATMDDEDNILSALLAKRYGVSKVISVLERPTYNQIVSTIGVDNAVSKRLAAVNRIMAYMRQGRVRSEIILGNQKTEILEFEALETSQVVGKPLKDIGFARGILVIAIIRDGEVIIPGGNDSIAPGDRVLLLTDASQIKHLEKMFAVKLGYF